MSNGKKRLYLSQWSMEICCVSVYDVVFFMLGVLDLQKCVFYFVRLYYVIQQPVIDIFHVVDCEYCKCINVILKK